MAYTDTTAVAGLVKAAYDRYVEFALRSQPLFRGLADKRPVQQAMPGSSVTFSLYSDLSAATSTLTETSDVTATALSNVSTVSVTLAEYGNTVLNTRKLSEFAFSDIDPAIANIVAFNMADSIDKIVVSTLVGGTNVLYGGSRSSTGTLTATDVMSGAKIRQATAKLRAANAVPREGMLFAAYISPEQSYDLRSETGALAFEDTRKYTDFSNIVNAVVGVYGGAYVVETPRCYNATDGATSAKVTRAIICGQQALAEATAVEPNIVIGPVVDSLMRFRTVGWYALAGWARYREASLYRVETGSTF